MNNRILELAKQAGFDVKRLRAPHPGGFPREDMLALESFAKLIVLRCANICFSEAEGHSMAFGEHCGVVIKEHFGVEE